MKEKIAALLRRFAERLDPWMFTEEAVQGWNEIESRAKLAEERVLELEEKIDTLYDYTEENTKLAHENTLLCGQIGNLKYAARNALAGIKMLMGELEKIK